MVYEIFSNRLAIGIISYVVFIVSASTHEYLHARSAYSLGDKTAYMMGRLTLNPIVHIDLLGSVILPILAAFTGIPVIGWMKAVPVNPYNFKKIERDQAIVSFAGPFANLMIATLSFILIKVITMPIDGTPLIYKILTYLNANENTLILNAISVIITFLWMFYILNIMLMIFNLLPFPPLDGGWILRFLLPSNGKKFYDQIYPYGFLILYALLFFGVLRIALGFVQSFSLLMLGNSIRIIFSI